MTRRTRILCGALAAVVVVGLVVTLIVWRGHRTEPAAPTTSTSTSTPTSDSPSGEMTYFVVYFHRGAHGDPSDVVAVPRSVPKTEAVTTAALNELLAGPTEAEKQSGYWSMFGPGTAGKLKSVRIDNGAALVDFLDFRAAVPDASSGFGSAALFAELDKTVRQFRTVQLGLYSFNGDMPAFYDWLQMFPPGQQGEAGAVAEARLFLIDVAGMRVVHDGPVRRLGKGLAEFTAYAASPNDSATPVVTSPTVVSLRLWNDRWAVTGTRADRIQVDAPKSGAVIRSPMPVSGRAHTFEGNVTVRVIADPAAEIGRGSVTGGGDEMRPFSGQIAFGRQNGGPGWVLFQELSAANGDVVHTTAVRIEFGQTG
ncbi:MAG TPA: Gmad2 immunoglobulin-like domain-containing protein [Lentzea sp.]